MNLVFPLFFSHLFMHFFTYLFPHLACFNCWLRNLLQRLWIVGLSCIKGVGRWGLILGFLLNVAYATDGGASIEITSPQDPMMNKILPGFVLHVENAKHIVTLRKVDGSAQVLMQLLKPIPYINTLKKYAEYVMVYYKGSHLTAQPQRRGYSFRYHDRLKCAGLLTYFDGTSYLLMSVCGDISLDETTKALSVAKKQLGLDEILYRTALPNVYY